ncbi:MAG: MFS transporter [Rhizomicrobium sp.]
MTAPASNEVETRTAPRDAGKLSLLSAIAFSGGTFPVSSLTLTLYIYLPPYLAGHLAVPLATVGGVWAAVRLVDLFVDPVLGHVMDLTTTRFGRYRPWLAAGTPIFMIAAFMLFMAPPGVKGLYVFVWLFVLYLGISILTLALWSWAASLAREYHERSRIFGILTAVGVIAGVVILLIPIAAPALGLGNDAGVRAMGWFVIALTPVTIAIALWSTPERVNPSAGPHFALRDYLEIAKKPEVLRLFFCQIALTLGPGWMSALYLFYFRDILKFTTQAATTLLLVYILAGVLGAPLAARASRRFGKHRTLMATTTAYSIGLLGLLVIPKGSIPAVIPIMAWCGFMAAGFTLLITAMMADVGDEIRLQQDRERMSLLYATLTFAAKIAAACSIAITFPLLDLLGFHAAEGVTNTPVALHGLQWAFLAGPIVFVMLGGACVWGWKLDAVRHADVRARLDARDAALYPVMPGDV